MCSSDLLAWTDLVHLSAKGQEIIGDLLADAIERGYDQWVATGGPSRVPESAPAELADAPADDAPAGDVATPAPPSEAQP